MSTTTIKWNRELEAYTAHLEVTQQEADCIASLFECEGLRDTAGLEWRELDAAESAALGNGREFTRQDHWPLIPAERAA